MHEPPVFRPSITGVVQADCPILQGLDIGKFIGELEEATGMEVQHSLDPHQAPTPCVLHLKIKLPVPPAARPHERSAVKAARSFSASTVFRLLMVLVFCMYVAEKLEALSKKYFLHNFSDISLLFR